MPPDRLPPDRLRPERLPAAETPELPLARWLDTFSPAYSGAMARLVFFNILAAAGTFVELQFLRALTVALTSGPPAAGASCSLGQWIASGFSLPAEACGTNLPIFLLATYTLAILGRAGFEMAALSVTSALGQRAKHDVERELLRNLLRQDDVFFIKRSPAEIVSRLSSDLDRVNMRRQNVTEGMASALVILATLLVLVMQSWLAAAIGLGISLIGVLSAEPRIRKLGDLDRQTVGADERVKTSFEDTLQGVSEIHVGGLLGRMLERFGILQNARDVVALRFADLNNRNNVAQKLTFSLGFVAIIGFFIGADVFSNKGESGTQTAGLIVVLIATLPELYFRFAELTMRFTQVRMAQQSVNRLLQYEAPALTPPGVATAPENTIRVEQARYRFSGGDIVLGGPDGMNCVFGPTGLTAIVGPAGAGKSTLIRLILGRQRLASGRILLPEDDGRPLFAYLPQRPILFDTPIRDNLFLGGATPELSRHVADHAALSRLGLIHLIRLKGLDAPPGPGLDPQTSLESVRTALRREIQDQLGLTLTPLGAGAFSPRQMTIEAQLSQAVDQGAFAARLGGEEGRRVVAALAATTGAEGLIALAVAALRASAALLARSGQAEDYNKVASFKIDPEIFGLRQMALMSLPEEGAPAPSGPEAAILVAVGLSLRLEEIAPAAPPLATGEFLHRLEELVEGVSRPLSPERVNPFLTWRENLLFAVPDAENASRQSRLDEILVEKITATPLDVELIESGLDYPVGRQGGRLSGGQQQLVGFGRALLTPSRFLALDEPSSAFHPQLRLKAIEVLRDEARSRGVIVVTHDLDLARACDRVIFIRDGAIAGQGAWEDLVAGTQGFAAWVNDSRVQP